MTTLKDSLTRQNATLASLTNTRDSLQADITALQSTVTAYETTIKDYREKWKELKKNKSELDQYVTTKRPMLEAAVGQNKPRIEHCIASVDQWIEQWVQHAKRLEAVIPKVGRFLDPLVAVAHDGGFWTPNGMHRLEAMKRLGAESIVALVVPEREIAYRILALNTEKAHNLKDKSLEVVRMADALAEDKETGSLPETTWEFEFEEPGLLTIGEAAAVTYPATGEGIGKAMESGMLAAALCRQAVAGERRIETLAEVYGAEFRRQFAPRYRAYAVAQSWASRPFMLDLLAARATRGRFAREELEALVAERGDARSLFSARGLMKALMR